MSDPIVKLERIVKDFGGIRALDQVSLDIFPNEIIGLVGENGAGKSTLIKVLSGAHPADSGTILVDGKETRLRGPYSARMVGIETVYQNMALFPALGIVVNLFAGREICAPFGIARKREMKRQARHILEKLKIRLESLNVKAGDLSGGQQHAIAIGRAVYASRNARVLLLDEPMAGLGAKAKTSVLQVISELKTHGVSVVMVSHLLDDVLKVADRIVVLVGGRVAVQMPAKDICKEVLLLRIREESMKG